MNEPHQNGHRAASETLSRPLAVTSNSGAEHAAPASGALSPSTPPVASSAEGAAGRALAGGVGGAVRRNFTTQDSGEGGFDPTRMLTVLRRRRWILLGTLLGTLGLGALYTFVQKPVYQAAAQILVSTPSSGGSTGANSALLSDVVSERQARSLGTQIALLQSLPVWKGALKRMTPEEQRELTRFAQLTVRPERDADVVDIVLSSRQPALAARMANALCDEYIQQNQVQNRTQVQAATRYVQSQLVPAKQRLDDASLALKQYQEQNGTVDVEEETKTRIAAVSSLEAAMRDSQAQRASDQARAQQLQAQLQALTPNQQTSATITASPAVSALKGQLTQLEIRRVELTREYTPQSRVVRDLDTQIGELRRRMAQEVASGVASKTVGVNAVREGLQSNLATTLADAFAMEARTQALQLTIGSARQELAALPKRAYRLSQLRLDQNVYETAYKTLNDKYQQLRITEEASLANANLISPAQVPPSPVSPRPVLNLVMALLMGSLLALCASALAEKMDNRVHSDAEVEALADLPVIAHVPRVPEAERALMNVVRKGGTSPLLETYRLLRSNISFMGLEAPVRSIVVTSSRPGEGKSSCSMNLAIAIALSGKRVIVADCDLRRPRIHQLFGVPNNGGFTGVVSGRLTLEAALQDTSVPNLRVLASGPLPPNPPELLDSRPGRACLHDLLDHADIVILDTPPSMMADALIVSTQADGVLVVVSTSETGKREIVRTSEMLQQSGARVLGLVLNKLSQNDSSDYGYYRYEAYGDYLKSGDAPQPPAAAPGSLPKTPSPVTPFDERAKAAPPSPQEAALPTPERRATHSRGKP